MIQTPAWVKEAVFYQIFPDRFARSERMPKLPGVTFKEWGSPPSEQGYQGGDLYGVADKLDYFQDLGITALYLCPIFSSASNHRYHPYDYMQVDPLLGGDQALRTLLDEAHDRNMHVVLDGVFNHASRGFWPFHHVLENGGDSPYMDWFIINGWPLRPYQHDEDNPKNYHAWWDIAALPKLNTNNPGVRDYIFSVGKYWVEFGIDGWRLDVPFEIDDDSFWQEFRRVVKEANPEAYIVGEIWGDGSRWLQGDQFDAVMNYLMPKAALPFFGAEHFNTDHPNAEYNTLERIDGNQFAKAIDEMVNLYDWEITTAQLNLMDSHDTPRLLWLMSENKPAMQNCIMFQMTMPGAPCVYYGSEIGMSGGQDPDCRGAYLWNQPETWDTDLFKFYQAAIKLRTENPVLRQGGFKFLYADEDLYAFERKLDGTRAMVLFNAASEARQAHIPCEDANQHNWKLVWNRDVDYTIDDKGFALMVPAQSVVVWRSV